MLSAECFIVLMQRQLSLKSYDTVTPYYCYFHSSYTRVTGWIGVHWSNVNILWYSQTFILLAFIPVACNYVCTTVSSVFPVRNGIRRGTVQGTMSLYCCLMWLLASSLIDWIKRNLGGVLPILASVIPKCDWLAVTFSVLDDLLSLINACAWYAFQSYITNKEKCLDV